MKKLFVIIILLLQNLSFSQKVVNQFDVQKEKISDELTKKGISTFFFLSKNCPVTVSTYNVETKKSEDFEKNEFTAYVFWSENSKILIQKFDNYGLFNVVEINELAIFKFVDKFKNKFVKENVLEYETIYEGKKVIIDIPIQCLTKFNFKIDTKIFENSFYESYLTKNNHINNLEGNLNYKKNNSLKTVQLFKLCNEAILKFEESRLFYRIK